MKHYLSFCLLVASSRGMFPSPSISEQSSDFPVKWIAKLKPSSVSNDVGGMSDEVVNYIYSMSSDVDEPVTIGDSTFVSFIPNQDILPSSAELNSNFEYIEKDEMSMIAGLNPPSWGINRIDQPDLPISKNVPFNPTYKGTGVDVFVIDSGVRETHNEFTGRIVEKVNFVPKLPPIVNDMMGHGTHVTGTIAGTTVGVARNASIHTLRVFGTGGVPNSVIIQAINYAVVKAGSKPSVISMSLGSSRQQALNDAANAAAKAGHIVVVAAGNQNSDACNYSPASAGGNASTTYGVITVGATNIKDMRAGLYSNFGKCVDIFAPGTDIYSSWNSSDTAYNTISGTSMATPHVAGVAAVLLEKNKMNKKAAMDELFSTAAVNKIANVGVNSPNLFLQLILNVFGICINQKCTSLFTENMNGTKLSRTSNYTFKLVKETTDLCDLTIARTTFANSAVIVQRGGCAITKKAVIAKKFGAKMLIVTMTQPNRTPVPIALRTSIPVIMVSYEYGQELLGNISKPISLQSFDPNMN